MPLVIDNTFASPYLCRPIDHGADIVVHSATKFLGGHGNSIGGIIVDSGKFAWSKGKFPQHHHAQPRLSRHVLQRGVRQPGLHHQGARRGPARFRPVHQPVQLRSCSFRASRRCVPHGAAQPQRAGRGRMAGKEPGVTWVKYPGLTSSPYHALSQKYLPQRPGPIVTFGIKGGREAGKKLVDNVKLFSHLANLGDAKSLVIHPSSTTHQQLKRCSSNLRRRRDPGSGPVLGGHRRCRRYDLGSGPGDRGFAVGPVSSRAATILCRRKRVTDPMWGRLAKPAADCPNRPAAGT